MTRPLRVFLCHASQDKPAVRKLHRYLKQHGIEPWLDEIDLLPGENWEVEIPRALNSSDVILVCLSKNSVNKEGYVQKEISFALDKALEKPEGTIFIIPAKLEDCEVPKRLNRYQWVDLFRPDSNKRLLLGLNKRVASLGSDVLPVILEDARQRKSNLKPIDISQLDRETQEKIVEKADREIIEEALLEKREQEQKETIEREAAKKTAREKLERDTQEKEKPREELKQDEPTPRINTRVPVKSKISISWSAGVILLVSISLCSWGAYKLVPRMPTPAPTYPVASTESPVAFVETVAPTEFFTSTPQPTKTPIPTPTLGIGSTMIGEKGETLVYVPAGEFTMGSDVNPDEQPIHTVYLDAFWIDQTEVTNKHYKACVDAGMCEPPSPERSYSHANYYGNSEFDDSPVIYVNWDKANRYCEVWAGGDLPTEAQWEKAARGIDARTYPWGNDKPSANLLNFNSNVGDTTVVKNYPNTGSFYGTYDMAGNVWEWVNDFYDEVYYQSSNSANNPLGPESGQYRVLRGGSWYSNDSGARSAVRLRYDPSKSVSDFGFRCSRSP